MEMQNRLREIRKEKDLTQEKLAGMVGVTRQTIISVEKGRFVPSVRLALELAQALEISVNELFWLEDSRGEEHE
jgi:putative transcriptional regulator